jgi:hypothetical protein
MHTSPLLSRSITTVPSSRLHQRVPIICLPVHPKPVTITILYFIHRPVFYFKHNISKTGFCSRLQVELTQLGPMDRASLCLRTTIFTYWAKHICSVPPDHGDRNQCPKCCVLNQRQDDGSCPEL